MAIKKERQYTELGSLPVDWKVQSCRDFSDPVRGGSPRPAGDPRYFNGNYIPWLTVAALTNISDSEICVTKTDTCLTEEGSRHSRTLQEGTLILANSGATLGVAKILGIRCCANDGIAALLNLNKEISPLYLAYYINTKTKYLREVVATGNGQPNLNTQLIGDFKVPLPSTRGEQESIANTLRDMDVLIEALEKLILKKRLIKNGAMQELLTGKRRLPPFSKTQSLIQTAIGSLPTDWGVQRLRDLIEIKNGYAFSSADFGETGPIILTPGNFKLDGGLYFNSGNTKHFTGIVDSKMVFKKGDLLLVMTDLTPDCNLLGKPAFIETNDLILHNQRIGKLQVQESVVNKGYLYWHFLSDLHARRIKETATGSTVRHTSSQTIYQSWVPLPTLNEQASIAEALDDIAKDLAAEEDRLEKVRNMKRGMMQELLTGRIRLI